MSTVVSASLSNETLIYYTDTMLSGSCNDNNSTLSGTLSGNLNGIYSGNLSGSFIGQLDTQIYTASVNIY